MDGIKMDPEANGLSYADLFNLTLNSVQDAAIANYKISRLLMLLHKRQNEFAHKAQVDNFVFFSDLSGATIRIDEILSLLDLPRSEMAAAVFEAREPAYEDED